MGFGTSPAGGSTPFGYGSPLPADIPPDGPSGCRYINPGKRDYELDPVTRQLKQMPALRQRVLLRLLTAKGSAAAIPTLGVELPRSMGTGFERVMADRVRSAFRDMTDTEKSMRIDSLEVSKLSSGRALVTLGYTDLTTGESDSLAV